MIDLTLRIVGFVDLLGYKAMVMHDSEASPGATQYVDRLYKISKTMKNHVDASIEFKFFSDCIVLSTDVSFESFVRLCSTCRSLQCGLLEEEILSRGGISFGKHFSDEDFLFSRGLVDAYLLEIEKARTPRIVISPDLIELYRGRDVSFLVKERDGLSFVDYLDAQQKDQIAISQKLIDRGVQNPALAEKLIWLGEYVNFRFGDGSIKLANRFS